MATTQAEQKTDRPRVRTIEYLVDDKDALDDLSELELYLDLSARVQKILLAKAVEGTPDITAVELDRDAAAGAGHFRARFQVPSTLSDFSTALRAVNRELRVIVHAAAPENV